MRLTRRRTLVAAGTVTGLAGCVGPSDTGSGTGTGGDVDYDLFQLGANLSRPLWALPENGVGFVTMVPDRNGLWMVDDVTEIDGLEAWLDDHEFGTDGLVYVASRGPDTCHREIGVDGVAIQDDAITATASVIDRSADDEACGEAITYPSALVSVSGPSVPDTARFTLTDGWGESAEVETDGRLVDPGALPGYIRPSGEATPVESFTCDDDAFNPHWGPDEVVLGDASADDGTPSFSLRLRTPPDTGDEPTTVAYGDEIRLSLWNISTMRRHTGIRDRWSLQILSTNGWRDVRGTTDDDPMPYPDLALVHRPGDGLTWTLELTERGILDGHLYEDRLVVCPELRTGRYRFVYLAAGGPGLAVEFDLVR